MLLPGACALDRLLVFEFRFDGLLSGAALSAHELCASTWPLVVGQHLSCEPQMAHVAALHAGVRLHIARAEASCRTSQTHRVSFVPLGMTQHVLVELVPGQYLLASVAAAGIRLALALDALFRVAFEVFWDLLNAARGAGMARYAAQCPISGFFSRMMPLTVAKMFLLESFAADCTFLPCTALCTLRRRLSKIFGCFIHAARGAFVACLASQEPIVGILRA